MKAIHKETRSTKANNAENELAIRAGVAAVDALNKRAKLTPEAAEEARKRIFGL